MKDGYYWVYDDGNEMWIIVFVASDPSDQCVCFLEKKETEPLTWLIDKSFVGPIDAPKVQLCTASMITI